MSSLAVPAPVDRVYRFYQTTVGKKAIMAVTGLILFAFIIGHLAGNLQVFEGAAKFDAYAVFLRSLPAALWSARIILLVSVTLHIITTIQLALLSRSARSVSYVKKDNSAASYASRTMYWSGPIVAAFVVYHLAQFTFLITGPVREGHPYDNVVLAFQQPLISIFYIIAMVLLGMHLSHGIWSMLQSLGITSPTRAPFIKSAALLIALVITLGFISIPVAVLVGWVVPTGGN
jgi:succinate dehydrogenase / fumarate reductase cytochrome b subunit